jgi:NAD(P)-dependent dehydrogenase (short-subunit alcohol dehydrogenase family)
MGAEFADRVAFVTGAGSGIGAAVAIRLASEGARVAVADIDDLGADRTVHLIRETGGHAEAVAVDVSDPISVEAAVAKTVASFGALHLAVNNAGVTGAAALTAEYDLLDWRRMIDVNLSGVFYCLHYEIPALLATGGGSIVNISSVLGTNGCRQQPAYAAASTGSSASPSAPHLSTPTNASGSIQSLPGTSRRPSLPTGAIHSSADR